MVHSGVSPPLWLPWLGACGLYRDAPWMVSRLAMTHSLWTLKAGDRCEILGYDQALADNYRTRMMEFGFHPGEIVTCVQSLAFGAPKVYRVSNTIFSLDQEVASHIEVRVLSAHE